jgi:hypothetical protein
MGVHRLLILTQNYKAFYRLDESEKTEESPLTSTPIRIKSGSRAAISEKGGSTSVHVRDQ